MSKVGIFLFTIIFLASSCGPRGPERSVSSIDSSSKLGVALEGGSTLSGDQYGVALRICYALRSKDTNYQANYLNRIFRFTFISHSCSRGSRNQVLQLPLRYRGANSPMQFDGASTLNIFRDVLTHRVGILASICTSLISGESASNTESYGSNDQSQFIFTAGQNGIDHFTERKARNNGRDFLVYQADTYDIYTDSNAAPSRISGLVRTARSKRECSNQGETLEYVQNFSSIN